MYRTHPVVAAYLALAELGTMSEPEGRSRVKTMFPEFRDQVDTLVEGFKSEALGRSPMDARIRNQFAAMRNASTIEPGQTDMNTIIRTAGNRGRVIG